MVFIKAYKFKEKKCNKGIYNICLEARFPETKV